MEENKDYLEKQKGEYQVEFDHRLILWCVKTLVPKVEVSFKINIFFNC